MIVAQDVETGAGMLLCKKGLELDEKWIDRLLNQNVKEVWVEGGEPPISEEERQELCDKIEAELDHMFEHVMDNAVMSDLCFHSKDHLKKQLGA